MMLPRYLLFLVAILFSSSVLAQTISVRGRVTDAANDAPLIGVTVNAGSSGTTTDTDGKFQLKVPAGSKHITVSMIGYTAQTVEINGEGPLLVKLASGKDLNEVIVVGYGTEKKKDLTGAISTLSSKDIGGRQTVQVSEALQGAVAGVSVTRSNGAPGAGSTILIRGITTIGSNGPLIIIDGVPSGNIDNVNPNDVESVTVLKDAASAAIYGSRGASGVILVTTKRAKEGQASFEYTYEYGVQKATALPKYTNTTDFMRLFNEYIQNDGGAAIYAPALIDHYLDSNRVNPDKFPNTNWSEAFLSRKYAPRQRHDLVFTIGTGKIKTKASIGYSKSDALYDNYNYERYLFRVNNDLQINPKLGVNLDIAYKRTMAQSPSMGGLIGSSRIMPGIYDDFYSDGRYAPGKDGNNPIADSRESGLSKSGLNQLTGRLSFNYKPINGLTLIALVAPTIDLDKSKIFSKQIKYSAVDDPGRIIAVNFPRTSLSETRSEGFSINGQLLASYMKEFGKDHTTEILAGYEENYNNSETIGASRDGFAVTGYPYLSVGSQEFRNNSGSASESALRSFFGRLKYNFRDKYYLQGNLRYDQSSRFAAKHRKAMFPSVSAGWNITEEGFMQQLKSVSFLKLRASWGLAGNERIGNYPYQATISFNNGLFYQNGVVVPLPTGAQVDYAVDDISWETTRTADVGLDAAFLDSRLTVSADYFEKRTHDILLKLDIPNYLGYEDPYQNAGIVEAKGWEFTAGWNDKIGKLNYAASFNLSDTKTRIVDLKGTQFLGDQAILQGGEFNEWFGYKTNGIYQTQEEVTGTPVLNVNTKAGDVRYVDLNKDGKITPEGDKMLLGGSLPRMLYGGNIRLAYGLFDAGIVFQGVAKRNTRLSNDVIQPFLANFGNVPQEIVGKFWSASKNAAQNKAAIYPRLSRASTSNNYTMSDFWLINGAYFRLKNLSAGYTLNSGAIKKAGLQSVRIYLSVNDLVTLSRFPKGWDPESGTSAYPIVTTMLAGATIKF